MGRFSDVYAEHSALSLKQLAIDGHALMQAFRLKPGPIIGQILQHLLEEVLLDPSLNEYTTLRQLAQSYLESLPERKS